MSTPAKDFSCPRCGYDLRGQWSAAESAEPDQCPMWGVCSECGLDYHWGDVFSPARKTLPRFVEHVTRPWVPFAAYWTWLWTFFPFQFWRAVTLEMPLRPGRIVAWFIMMVLPSWFIGAAAAISILISTASPGSIRLWPYLFNQLLFRFYGVNEYTGEFEFQLRSLPGAALGIAAASITMPLVLLCLPWTRARAKVKVGHVMRAGLYGMVWLVPAFALRAWAQIEAELYELKFRRFMAGISTPPSYSASPIIEFVSRYWFLVLAALMLWMLAWWWGAIRIGWRIKSAGPILWAIMIPGALAALTAFALSEDGMKMFYRWK